MKLLGKNIIIQQQYTTNRNKLASSVRFWYLHPVHVSHTVKPVLNIHSKEDKMVSKPNYRLMQVKNIAEHSAILALFLGGRFRQVLLYV